MPLNSRLTRIQGQNRIKETLVLDTEFYIVLWVTGGKGVLKVDCKEYELVTNRVFYIAPGQRASFLSPPQAGYLLHFSEDFLINSVESKGRNTLLEWLLIPQVFFDLDDIQLLDFKSFWEILERNWMQESLDFLIAKLINIIWVYPQAIHIRSKDNRSLKEDWDLMRQLKRSVELHYKEHKDSRFYAKELNVPLWRLNKIAKQVLGSSVHDVVSARTLLEAKRLLGTTRRSIKEINFELGFKDPSYFNKVFKRLAGVSPSAYRSNR
ncbi:helix-turn-helix transcriptional regulator [Olivibacter sp. CPCC 100613]|uniref:AraC family transcriptional regulator n=1 Tax=Olivibacter sp. CPCC 100613 TaxID=3079931 RepID=UPI002FF5D621